MINLEDIIGPQFCSLCDHNIGQSVKIRSVQHEAVGCAGKPLVVCLECHRTGVTISTVSGTQTRVAPTTETVGKYVVLDNLNFQLFHRDWTAKEELLLI